MIDFIVSNLNSDVQRFIDQNVTLRVGRAGKGLRGWVYG
jgi:hypothetical protein